MHLHPGKHRHKPVRKVSHVDTLVVMLECTLRTDINVVEMIAPEYLQSVAATCKAAVVDGAAAALGQMEMTEEHRRHKDGGTCD